MAYLATAVLVVIISSFLWWLLRPTREAKLLAKIPGPKPLPIIGNLLELGSGTDFYYKILEYCNRYRNAPCLKIRLGTYPLVIIHSAEAAQIVLSTEQDKVKKSFEYSLFKVWVGDGLAVSGGKKWQWRRKMITPAFHFKILTDFHQVFKEQSQILVEKLNEKCDEGIFNIYPLISFCALDIICETAMGKKMNVQQTGADSQYLKTQQRMTELLTERIRRPWEWSDFIYNKTAKGRELHACAERLHSVSRKLINERRELMKNAAPSSVDEDELVGGGKRRLAFLDLLLQVAKDHEDFTDSGMQEEVDTFLFGGQDTVSSSMGWVIYMIGSHPDVQRKIQEELTDIFGDTDRAIAMDDLNRMKYLDCVIKETMRIFPSVPLIGRQATEDIEICGFKIPKGTSFSVLIPAVHRDPKYFPDPEKFDPERFNPDNSSGRHPFAYIPFSAGPRNCIGFRFALNEEKCVLSSIIRKFWITATQTFDELQPRSDMVLHPRDGIMVKLTRRVPA